MPCEQKLCELPSPVTSGAVLTVEDYLQHFKCSIHIKHREDISEEDHPDKMILHGQLPVADTTAAAAGEAGASEVQNGEEKEGNAAGGEDDDDDDDDDVVLFEPDAAAAAAAAGETVGEKRKRRREEEKGAGSAGGSDGTGKKVKVDVVEVLDD
ncbi:unnamed protein product [Closterium sp. NIES-54]